MLNLRFKLSHSNGSFVSTNLSTGRSVALVTSIGVARSIAYRLPLPGQKKFDYRNYYRIESGLYIKVSALLSTLNEIVTIDHDTIQRFIEALYMFRCQTAFPRDTICCLSDETAVADFFDFGCCIPADMMSLIASSSLRISVLANGFTELFKDPVFASSLENFIENT